MGLFQKKNKFIQTTANTTNQNTNTQTNGAITSLSNYTATDVSLQILLLLFKIKKERPIDQFENIVIRLSMELVKKKKVLLMRKVKMMLETF